jgi:hypothetical protein
MNPTCGQSNSQGGLCYFLLQVVWIKDKVARSKFGKNSYVPPNFLRNPKVDLKGKQHKKKKVGHVP